MFGGTQSTFGAPASSAFGQTTNTLFGAASKPVGSVFGQPAGGSSLFGGSTQTNTLAWGATTSTTSATNNGTSIPFTPSITPETIQRGSQTTQINAKHMCITAMKEYQDKSLEELRLQDYAVGRQNGPTAATGTTANLFGATTTVKPFQFGATQTSTTTSSLFGQPKPTNTLFGASTNSPFGATSTSTQPLFGQQTQTQGGLFGLSTPFGTPQTTTNLFGAPSTAQSSGFAFGQQPTQSSSLFGAKPLFGATSTTQPAATGLFGAAQPAATTASVFGFNQTQPQQQSFLFGQSTAATKPSIFGAQTATATVAPFGSTTTNLFGAPKTTAATTPFFGTSTAFSTQQQQQQQQQQSGFAFGGLSAPKTTGLFGAPAASTTGGLFGQAASTGGFGFGSGLATSQTPALGGAFGVSSTTSAGSTGLFGQSTPKKTFGFGTTFTNPTVSSATGLFGQPAQPTGGLFGASATPTLGTGSLFGQAASGFGIGQKPAATGGFNLGGSVGLGTGTTNLFGSTAGAAAPTLGTGFGAGFGTVGQPTGPLTGLVMNNAEQMAQSVRAQQQVLELVRSMPYGQSPLFRYLNMPTTTASEPDGKPSTHLGTSSGGVIAAKAAATALVERQKAAGLTFATGSPGSLISPTSVNRNLRMRRPLTGGLRPIPVANRSKLFSGFYEEDAFESPSDSNRTAALRLRHSMTPSAFVSESPGRGQTGPFLVRRDEWKRLQLPESVRSSILERSNISNRELSQLAEASIVEDSEASVKQGDAADNVSFAAGDVPVTPSSAQSQPVSTHLVSPATSVTPSSVPEPSPPQPVPTRQGVGIRQAREALHTTTGSEDSTFLEDLDQTWASPRATNLNQSRQSVRSPPPAAVRAGSPTKGIRLSKPGYYTLPTIEELNSMTDENGRCVVEDFVVGRRNYGHILFPGPCDLTDLNLDDIVHIRRREVVVYPDDEKKPPVGCGLNKRAEICLESIWPTDKSTLEPIKSPERLSLMRFEQRLERATRRMDARFIEYRPESGSWVFEVKHFSKYRLEDSDDDDDGEIGAVNQQEPSQLDTKSQRRSLDPTTKMNTAACYPKSFTKVSNTLDGQVPYSLNLSTIEELNMTTNMQSPIEPRAPSLALRQALFRPTRTTSKRDSQFSDEEFDEDEDEMAELGKTQEWKYPRDTTEFDFSVDDSKRISKQHLRDYTSFAYGDKPLNGPTPEKLSRMVKLADTSPLASSKWEQYEDEMFIDQEKHHAGMTPFRPIFSEPLSEGVPITSGTTPPATAELQGARIPAHLKSVTSLSGIFPYPQLFRLLKDDGPYRASKPTDVTTMLQPSTENLSRLLLDAGLFRGHGMRPSWGLARSTELHCSLLITVNRGRENPCFSLQLNTCPSPLEQADESLLNAALMTSNRQIEWVNDASPSSADPTSTIPSDHCPLWQPEPGLGVLEAYGKVLFCSSPFEISDSKVFTPRMLVVRRLISLCLALWGRHPSSHNQAKLHDDDPIDVAKETPIERITDADGAGFEEQVSLTSSDEAVNDYPSALKMLARKQAVSEWIRSHSRPWLESCLKSSGLFDVCCGPTPPSPKLLPTVNVDCVSEGIFACLLAGEPAIACRLALAACMPHLASLIAQSSASDEIIRRGLSEQMKIWHESRYDQHIPLAILRIFALLAGLDRFPHPKNPRSMVWVLDGADWIRVLGAYLWYFCPYQADLPTVLDAYCAAWRDADDSNVARPLPPRQCDLKSPPRTYQAPRDFRELDGCWTRDTAYHLLRLFCNRSHNLEHTLNPCSMSRTLSASHSVTCKVDPDSLLDWTPSWVVWRVLSALYYHHFSSEFTRSRVCDEFAAQLEDGGLWEWAVFVMLHKPDQVSRDAGVKNLIARHASLVLPNGTDSQLTSVVTIGEMSDLLDSISLVPAPSLTKAEQLVVQLGVPVRWMHEAKAILARRRFASCRQSDEVNADHLQARLFALLEASHWYAAGHFDAAHNVCFDFLLPNLVLHTNMSLNKPTASGMSSIDVLARRLDPLVRPFASLDPSQLPADFATGVGIYVEYAEILHLASRLAHLSQPDDPLSDDAQTELACTMNRLHEQLEAFVERLQSMMTPNLISSVVKTEMAATCTQLLSAFLVTGLTFASETDSSAESSALLQRLQHQLTTMTKVGLPSDQCLKELSALCTAELSLGIV